jgi:hypothetical protein
MNDKKNYEEALKSSSAAFQLPPSSIDRAWANKVVFMRSLSSLEYFQASLLPSIYIFKIQFSSETSASHLILRYTSAIHQLLSCRLGSYPSPTNPHTTTSQAFPKHTPTQLNQRARTSLVRSFRPSIHQRKPGKPSYTIKAMPRRASATTPDAMEFLA